MNILDEIFAHKRVEVAEPARAPAGPGAARSRSGASAAGFCCRPLARLGKARPARGFIARPVFPSVDRRGQARFALARLLVEDFDPLRLARIYQDNGAAAISVLTDERYFQGSLDHLRERSRS